ncbi:unnamed protein product, partial [Soboliphyme baturini]|uniref:Uncharacterized protein n=1 Tax=Soboliphyme baturini TaxID=241478 RepID=A0A183JA54_9BILA
MCAPDYEIRIIQLVNHRTLTELRGPRCELCSGHSPFFLLRLLNDNHLVTQTIARVIGPRSQIAIPAQGIVELRDALTELLDEYGKGKAVIILFYFDIGQNNRGVFMRISEVFSFLITVRMSLRKTGISWITKIKNMINQQMFTRKSVRKL